MKRFYYSTGEFSEENEDKIPSTQDENDKAFLNELFHDFQLSPKYSKQKRDQYDYIGGLDRIFYLWKGDKRCWLEHTARIIKSESVKELEKIDNEGGKPNYHAIDDINSIFEWIENKLTEVITFDFMSVLAESDTSIDKIKWLGSPSQFGYIFGKLVEKGFVGMPVSKGRPTYAEFARICMNVFEIDTELSTLKKEVSLTTNSLDPSNKEEFTIPDISSLP